MDITITAEPADVAMLIALTTIGRRFGDYDLSNWCMRVRRQLIAQMGSNEVSILPQDYKPSIDTKVEDSTYVQTLPDNDNVD